MLRRPPGFALDRSAAAADVYKRQVHDRPDAAGHLRPRPAPAPGRHRPRGGDGAGVVEWVAVVGVSGSAGLETEFLPQSAVTGVLVCVERILFDAIAPLSQQPPHLAAMAVAAVLAGAHEEDRPPVFLSLIHI